MAIIKIVQSPRLRDVIKKISKKYNVNTIEKIERHAFNLWHVRLEPRLPKKLRRFE